MTPFTVDWDPDLEAHFVDTWVSADSQTRALLREIANWVDENLLVDPDIKGKEKDQTRFVFWRCPSVVPGYQWPIKFWRQIVRSASFD